MGKYSKKDPDKNRKRYMKGKYHDTLPKKIKQGGSTKPLTSIEETDETISKENKITKLGEDNNEPPIREFGILEESNAPNLLLLACKEGRLNEIQNFLKYGLDIDYEDEDKLNAVDNVWINYRDSKREDEKDKYEKIILSLIEANSKNPSRKVKFNIDIAPSMVRNLTEICESLHRYVEHDEEKKLLAEIKNHPNLRYFYDRNNESLLLFTLKLHKINFIKIFDGALSIGRNESLNEVFYKYSKKRHNTILGSAEEKLPNPHIIILKSKSMIFNMSDQNHTNWKYIENAFNKLDENEAYSRVLSIAAPYKNLKIYFDFQKDVNFKPNQGNDNKTTFESGIIYIGAKDFNGENEAVLSALISQLCNIAIHLSCLDYYDPNMADDFEEDEEDEADEEEEEVEPADKNPNLQEDNSGDDKEQATKHQLMELIKKTLNDQNIHLYDYFIMLDIQELLDIIDILQDEEQFIDYDGLTQPMKMKILHSKIIFQDVETSLYDIVGDNLHVLNALTTEDIRNVLLRNIKLEIGESRKAFNKHKIIDRELIQSNVEDDALAKCEKIKDYEQIKADVEESKNFILSDNSGTGKTVKFGDLKRKLKEDSKNVWISFIKLRDHQEMLTKYESEEDELSLDTATQILLDILNIKSEVEIEIFKQLFHDGKVILLLDGFDEIDQTLKDFWLKIKSLLNKKIEKIQFWISTRPQPSKVLLENTNGKPYKFTPLTQNDKNKIIIDTLAELNFCIKSDEVPQNLRIFIDLVEHEGQCSIDNPLMLITIVEIFAENQADFEPESFNFYTIFERVFLKQKAKFDEKTDNKNFSLFEKFPASKVHQVYGLKLVFGKMNNQNLNNLAIMKMWSREQRRWTSERIQHHGFLSVDLEDKTDNEGHPGFIHKSYADFFAVQYIISYMFSEDCSINEAEFKKIFELLRIIASSYDEYQNVQKLILGFIKCNDCTFHSEMSNIFSNYITLITSDITTSENSTISEFWNEILNQDSVNNILDTKTDDTKEMMKSNEYSNMEVSSDVTKTEGNIIHYSESENNLQLSNSKQLESALNKEERIENLQPFNILKEGLIKISDKYIVKLLTNENKIVDRNAKQKCKILQISSKLNIDQKLAIISTLEPSEYSNLFIFIIEHQNEKCITESQGTKAQLLEESLTKFGTSRPLIIQQICEAQNETKFYYKSENSSEIVEIHKHNPEDSELYKQWKHILSYLDNELQPVEDEMLKKLSYIKNSSIILRLLRTLNLPESFFEILVTSIPEKGSKADLLAILDASFEDNGRILNNQAQNYIRYVFEDEEAGSESDEVVSDLEQLSDEYQYEEGTSSQSKNEHSSQSVLSIAVQHSNQQVIEYLITYWTPLIQELPIEHQIRISTTAFDTKQFDVLCDLLEFSDFPFPNDFSVLSHQVNNERLQKIVTDRIKFHESIEQENYKEINHFIDNNLSLKFIYGPQNITAMKKATDLRKYKIYFHLKSFGLCASEFRNLNEVLDKIELSEANAQTNIQKSESISDALRHESNSVLTLCAKSLIHNRSVKREFETKYRKCIKKWFEDIKKIAQDMLDVAASCENLVIIFDFESKLVNRTALNDDTLGLSYTTVSSRIFIGAKLGDSKREQEIKGVLAHELCHYVMFLVYDNKFLPYYTYATDIRDIFDGIVKSIDKWSSNDSEKSDDGCDGIISSVFTSYPVKCFHYELIVRAIQILILYDHSAHLQEKYQNLFDFWFNLVVPDMQNYYKNKAVTRINATVGLLSSLSNRKIELIASKNIKKLTEKKLIIAVTNVSKLLFANIHKYLQEEFGSLRNSENLFLEPEKINDKQIWKDLMDLYTRNVKLNIFVDCSKDNLDDLSSILNIEKFNFILVASSKVQFKKLYDICTKMEINPITADIKYNWSDLTQETQIMLLQTKVTFQNNPEISLMEFLSRNTNPDKNEVEKILVDFSSIINDQLFNQLIDRDKISINSNVDDSNETNFEILFRNRNFLKKGISFKNEISQEKLISITANNKYVLISDIAKSGKSWAVRNISRIIIKQDATRWVTYVDLKQFIQEFKWQFKNLEFANFFIQNILKPKTKFEEEIFKKLYKNGKVSIIFDAFDEIAPDCAEFVADLAKSFEFNDGNQLWIVTRDYFEINLKEKLEINDVYKLNEFTEEDGVNLIVKSWILMDFKDQKINNFENHVRKSPNLTKYQEKATKIVQKVTMYKNQSIGLPQLLSMIADGCKDDRIILDDFKGAKIFTKFVQTIYIRWLKYSQLREDANAVSLDYEMNFKEFHQYCALLSLFPELVDLLFPDYDISEWPKEDIIAGGFLNKIGSSYSFIHETFREYFVADFIFKAIKKPKIKKEIIELLIKVLTIQKYGVIRMFLNDFIENNSVMEKIQLELEESVEKFNNMENLSEYFTENLEQLAKCVIKILKNGEYENVKKIISENVEDIATNTKDLKMFSKFTEFLLSKLKVQDLKAMINNQNILHKIIGSEADPEIFGNFMQKVKDKVGEEFIQQELKLMPPGPKNGNIFYHLGSSVNLCNEKAQKCFTIIQKYLTDSEIVELMEKCTEDGQTILKILAENTKNFKPFFDGAECFFAKQILLNKFKNIVCKTDSNGKNVLHWSADKDDIDFHTSLWKLIQKTLKNYEDLKTLIPQKSKSENNFLHLLIINNKSDMIELTLQELKKTLKKSDYQEILRSKGQFGRNLLQVAAVNSKEVKTHQILWKKLRDSYNSDEELLDLLGVVDEDGNGVFNLAASFTTAEVLEFMENEVEKMTHEKIRKMLLKLGRGNNNLLQAAAKHNKSLELHQTLWMILQKYFNSSEILEFVTQSDINGGNLIINVIEMNTVEVIELTWKKVKKLLNNNGLITEEHKESIQKCEKIIKSISEPHKLQNDEKEVLKLKWIKSENSESSKLFDEAIQELVQQSLNKIKFDDLKIFTADENIENHEKLWENLLKIYKTRADLKQVFFEKDQNGNNYIHLLLAFNIANVIDFTMNELIKNLGQSYYQEILRSKGQFGRNLLQVAAVNSKEVKTHQILWKKLRDSYNSDEELLDLLGVVDEDGNGVFNLAASFTTAEVLEFMENELEKIKSSEKRKTFIKLGPENRNLLQIAAGQNKSLKLHEVLWEIIQKYFNSTEILEFIKHRDSYGDNLLLNVISENTKEVKELTWNNVKNILIDIGCEDNDNLQKCDEIIKEDKSIRELTKEEKGILKLDCIDFKNSAKLFEGSIQLLKRKATSDISLEDLMPFIGDENLKNHDHLWRFLEESCKDLKKLLFGNNISGENFIHLLVTYNTTVVIEFTLQKLKENLSESEYPEILRSKGRFGRNLLQVAAVNSEEVKTHQILWKVLRDSSKSDECFLKILGEVDKNGNDIFNIAAEFTTSQVFEFMENELEKIKSSEIRKTFIKLGPENRNLLQIAARHNKSLEFHKTFWKILQKYYNSSEILEFIKHSDTSGDNLLIIAKKWSKKDILEFIWTDVEQLLKFIYPDNETGQKIIKCKQVIENIADAKGNEKGNKYEEDKLLKLEWIKTTNSGSSNLFDKFTQDILRNNLNVTTLNDLKPIVKNRNVLNHEILWDYLLKTFENRQNLAKLFFEKDKDGNNFVHLIAIYNTPNMIEFTLQKLKKNLNESDYQDILRSKGQNGSDLLQLQSKQKKSNQNKSIITKYREKVLKYFTSKRKYVY